MARYLVLYTGSGPSAESSGASAPDHQAMMQAWLAWRDAAGDAIVDFGAPTTTIRGGATEIGGYSIVQAETAGALDAIFETNPHLQQGGNLEFHEIIEIPGG